MFYSLSDLSFCSNPNKFNCSENWDTKDCGQLEHAKFKNRILAENNFSYEDLFVVNADHGDEFCELKDGSEISIQDVLISVWFDFSFMMTEKINDLLNILK